MAAETPASSGTDPSPRKHLRPARPRRGDYANLDEPNLTPMYGVRAFSTLTTCEHIHPYGPIPQGSKTYCESCCKTGVEHYKVFAKDARDRTGSREWPAKKRNVEAKPKTREPRPTDKNGRPKPEVKQFRRTADKPA